MLTCWPLASPPHYTLVNPLITLYMSWCHWLTLDRWATLTVATAPTAQNYCHHLYHQKLLSWDSLLYSADRECGCACVRNHACVCAVEPRSSLPRSEEAAEFISFWLCIQDEGTVFHSSTAMKTSEQTDSLVLPAHQWPTLTQTHIITGVCHCKAPSSLSKCETDRLHTGRMSTEKIAQSGK